MNLTALAFAAAASVIPPQPTSFETVNLRMTVDSCTFVPETVRITMAANVVRVTQNVNNCLLPGTPRVADVQLGALPAGDYRVELYMTPQPSGSPVESLAFQVRDPAQIAVVPPPPRPLTDYTGLWFNMQESGWGLSLFQGPTHAMFGLLFVYDNANRPEWYSIQGGHWTSSTTWTGTVWRTTGPAFGGAFDPSQVAYAQMGTASLDFTQSPGEEGRARLTYSIGNTSTTKIVTRMPL
jgi:hypothetical protein